MCKLTHGVYEIFANVGGSVIYIFSLMIIVFLLLIIIIVIIANLPWFSSGLYHRVAAASQRFSRSASLSFFLSFAYRQNHHQCLYSILVIIFIWSIGIGKPEALKKLANPSFQSITFLCKYQNSRETIGYREKLERMLKLILRNVNIDTVCLFSAM